MAVQSGRYTAPAAATAAEGWVLERLTRPSRLFSANGIRTGADGRIYVAQVAGSQVSALDVDSGEIETISAKGGAIVGPDDLAFDDDGNLYVTEITENQVRVLEKNGASRVIMGDVHVANPITYHRGMLIAGELRMGARIMELSRDGGAPRVIADNLPMVNAFEVGPDGKLYFPAQAANEIWRVDLAGGTPEVVATGLGVPDSVKFHPDGYIVSTQVISGQVLKIDPRTGDKEVLAQLSPGLDNVAFVDGRTFVSHINGSITELLGGGAYKATVDNGLQWPLSVAIGPEGSLFVADGGFTYTLKRGGGNLELLGMLFTPGFPGWTRDVVSSGAGEWVVTTANGTVNRWRPEAQENEELASGYDRLMGVAIGQNGAVVFAEMPTGRILSVEGSGVTELASGLSEPMGVAVAEDGTVFVAEAAAGRVVKLAGARTEVVIDNLGEPNGIAIHRGKLYALDIKGKTLIESDLSGGNQRVIAAELPVGSPYGVQAKPLGGVGDMCGPMTSFVGIDVGPDGVVYIAGDAEGSVLRVRPEA